MSSTVFSVGAEEQLRIVGSPPVEDCELVLEKWDYQSDRRYRGNFTLTNIPPLLRARFNDLIHQLDEVIRDIVCFSEQKGKWREVVSPELEAYREANTIPCD